MNIFTFLRELDAAHIHFTLRHSRPDAIMVKVNVPGERWEIEFLEDGCIDVEIFSSQNGVKEFDQEFLNKLLKPDSHSGDCTGFVNQRIFPTGGSSPSSGSIKVVQKWHNVLLEGIVLGIGFTLLGIFTTLVSPFLAIYHIFYPESILEENT